MADCRLPAAACLRSPLAAAAAVRPVPTGPAGRHWPQFTAQCPNPTPPHPTTRPPSLSLTHTRTHTYTHARTPRSGRRQSRLRVEGEHGGLVPPDHQEGRHVLGHHLQPGHVERRVYGALPRHRQRPVGGGRGGDGQHWRNIPAW